MILTILITVWVTCGIIYVAQESTTPYYADDFWLLDFICAPYFLILDYIDDKKSKKEIENN